ncbi:hypothetical protein [Streptomyces lavendulocolor]|uniref:hypothetical protein n=1 Tax=Streptomyces lavendulocolor TaxID=67316 RepID=UPI003C2E242A
METTLSTYAGPATIAGEAVPDLRLRVFADYDEGVVFPDEPVELVRGWEAEASFSAEPKVAQAWVDAQDGVEVRLPGVPRAGRAFVTNVRPVAGGGLTVSLTGAGAPPVPES